MVRKLSASHVSQPAASRRDWGPVEAARYHFELLKLLSTDRRVEATARRMGLYGAEALPSRPRQPTKEKASSQGGSLDEAGTRKRRPRQLTAERKAKVEAKHEQKRIKRKLLEVLPIISAWQQRAAAPPPAAPAAAAAAAAATRAAEEAAAEAGRRRAVLLKLKGLFWREWAERRWLRLNGCAHSYLERCLRCAACSHRDKYILNLLQGALSRAWPGQRAGDLRASSRFHFGMTWRLVHGRGLEEEPMGGAGKREAAQVGADKSPGHTPGSDEAGASAAGRSSGRRKKLRQPNLAGA
jgi:hypothetical protein